MKSRVVERGERRNEDVEVKRVVRRVSFKT